LILEITPRADRQINAARRWWLQNRDNPETFDEEIDHAHRWLRNAPHGGYRVRTRHGNFVRRITLERIRYYLYYRVHPGRIEVFFFWHTSRRPPRL
jgi:plasmid stabilization system protein ParE